MNVTEYSSYFRNLAIRSKKLKHCAEAELPDAEPGTSHFTFFTQDDLLSTKLRSRISTGAVLHLHLYDYSERGADTCDTRRIYDAGLMVTQHAAPKDEEAILAAYANTEMICNDLENAMMLDYLTSDSCSLPFGIPDFNKISVSAVGPIWDSRFGWFVSFPFEIRRDTTADSLKTAVDNAFNPIS